MKLCTLVCIFGTWAGIAFAQSDDFTISQQIGGDTTAPSIPANLAAVPVAHAQIDLSWDASVDDVELGGYQVYRDAVQIATTTLTTYSDSGLLASTTYTYSVRAFDTSYNQSSSSNSVSTTTLPLPSVPVSDDSGGADVSVDLLSFSIDPSIHSARLSWKTDRYARFELRWGRTASYELGFVVNEVYAREHQTIVAPLEPGTRYEFQLVGYGRDDKGRILEQGTFTTLFTPDTEAPANVFGLKGSVLNENVALRWNNPIEDDFAYVRIVRSHLFHPTDPYDGFIVYQGNAEAFTDIGALLEERTLYYTAFAYDDKGNISSGASIVVYPIGVHPVPADVAVEEDLQLSFADIEVYQHDVRVQDAVLRGGVPFFVRIAYERLPEHLKTVIVAFTHPSTREESLYLLRINKDKTYYEAFIPFLPAKGTYQTTVTVYDHETKRALSILGELHVSNDMEQLHIPFLGGVVGTVDQGVLADIWFYLLLLLLLAILFELFRTLKHPHHFAHMPVLRSLHMVFLFVLAGTVSYVLLSLPDALPKLQHGALIEAGVFAQLGVLLLYTLVSLLAFVALISVAAYFRRK